MGNKGAFITLTKDLKPEFTVYEAVVSLARCTGHSLLYRISGFECKLSHRSQFAIVRNAIRLVQCHSQSINLAFTYAVALDSMVGQSYVYSCSVYKMRAFKSVRWVSYKIYHTYEEGMHPYILPATVVTYPAAIVAEDICGCISSSYVWYTWLIPRDRRAL